MASKEGQGRTPEENGTRLRNVGIVIGIIGLLAAWEKVAIGGGVLAASGEIYRRVKKPKKQ